MKAGGLSYKVEYRVRGDDGSITGTVSGVMEAAHLVLERNGRIWLKWSRTEVRGEEQSFDFSASFDDDLVGRILREDNVQLRWSWHLNASDPRTNRIGARNGVVETRDEAVSAIERAFTEFIAWEG
ncbi:hypothetical protein MAUB1S_11485 [Mycolicibacterium aubagnense]